MNGTNGDLEDRISTRSSQTREQTLADQLNPNPIYGSSRSFQNVSQLIDDEPRELSRNKKQFAAAILLNNDSLNLKSKIPIQNSSQRRLKASTYE